jgi:hypothetical protein
MSRWLETPDPELQRLTSGSYSSANGEYFVIYFAELKSKARQDLIGDVK